MSSLWLLLACLVPVLSASGQSIVFYDDFSTCGASGLNTSQWSQVTRQWGCGNCNGGVNPELVSCGTDVDTGKTVLQLAAHGDKFTGAGPKGVYRNGSYRAATDEFSGWAWKDYHHDCSPHCDVQRVGSTVHTIPFFGYAGNNVTVDVRMKGCNSTGAASAIWMYNYTEVYCPTHEPNPNCSQAYIDQCCGGTQCFEWTDICWGEWVHNQEIDIELPTASYPTDDPAHVNFDNMRFTTITALPSVKQAKCGVDAPCELAQYRNTGANQNDGKYHLYSLTWLPPTDTFNGSLAFYVDGSLQAQAQGRGIVPDNGQLWLGAWIPNGWAGSPDFDTCTLQVDYVRITSTPLAA